MQLARPVIVLAALVALPQGVGADTPGRHAIQVDSAQSRLQFEIDSTLGACTLRQGTRGKLSGEMELVLQPGLPSGFEGRFDGGELGCQPDIVGYVPNRVAGLPPLLEVRLRDLVVRPRSRTFQCDANGLFQAETSFEVVRGELEVRLLGGARVDVPIVGAVSKPARSHGKLWMDGSGIQLVRELGNDLDVGVPELGLNLHVAIRGVIRGSAAIPPPTRLRPACAIGCAP